MSTLLIGLSPYTLPAAAAAAELGVVSDVTWGTSRAEVDRTVAAMERAGVRWARMNASWSWLEPARAGEPNVRALAELDYAVERVRRAGIAVLMPIADGVPRWASADPSAAEGRWNRRWPPRDPDDYAGFAARLVQRYAPRGVHAYEVWNEPNLNRFWPSGPNARDYVTLLRPAARAIRAADPGATVCSAGSRGTTIASSSVSTTPARGRTSTSPPCTPTRARSTRRSAGASRRRTGSPRMPSARFARFARR